MTYKSEQFRSAALMSGYGQYTSEQELMTMTLQDAPAITPATPGILSVIAESSVACGAGVSAVGGSAVGTIAKGC